MHSSIDDEAWGQFHQHFMLAFFANILRPKNYKAKCDREKLREALLYEKHAHKMLMKSTPGANLTNMFTFSFYALRSQKGKYKRYNLTEFLRFWDLREVKLLVNMFVGEIDTL